MKIFQCKNYISLFLVFVLGICILASFLYRFFRCVQQVKLNELLIASLKHNDTTAVLSLLDQGADANSADLPPDTRPLWQQLIGWVKKEHSPFHSAATLLIVVNHSVDNDVVVKALLDHGAVTEERESSSGCTPLMLAAGSDQMKCARVLIDYGANVNASNGGNTVLMYAIWMGQDTMCTLLLARGANIDAQDRDGRTPLMHAISGQYETIVNLLLSKNAQVNIKAHNGDTALLIARRKLSGCVSLLK